MAVTLIHLPALAVIVVGTALVRSTATKGTVRLLLGLVTLVTTWVLMGMWLGDGWVAVADGVAIALGGAVALTVWPPIARQAAVLIGRIRLRDRVGLVPPVIEARSALVTAVRDSIGASHDEA